MHPQIRLDRSSGVPLHQQLSEALRRLILEERLAPGSRLPASRQAASELGVSRNVVVLAYEQLRVEGYVRSAVGVGTWVPASIGRHLLRPAARSRSGTEERPDPTGDGPQAGLSKRGRRMSIRRAGVAGSRPTYPLRPAAIAADRFPVRTWTRIATRLWRTRTSELVQYGEVQGLKRLREALTEYLATHRGVRVTPERILITGGSQQSLDMIARMLLDPGDRVAVENPGYDGAIGAFEAAGAELVPLAVVDDGVDIALAGRAAGGVRLLYTTPSHQYPLGVTLSLQRRLALLEWARRTGAWVVEDDYDSEFRFETRPLPSLQGLDGIDRVVYVGTLSKVLAPALRLAYIVLPASLVDAFVNARQLIDNHPPIHIQATLAAFIAEGHLERHIARMRSLYGERRDFLIDALRRKLPGEINVAGGDGGLHITAYLQPGVDDVAVARNAFERRIDPQPLSAHYLDEATARHGLTLGFGGFTTEVLDAAVDRLAESVRDVARQNRSHAPG